MAGIFISYRRDDSQALAGRLYDRLIRRFGKDYVFRDIDALAPGARFSEVIGERIGSCNALIALIGKGWLESKDADGRRRLTLPRDFVKAEIAAALAQGKLVIPALIEGTPMPARESLPDDIAPLADCNALAINDSHFDFDVGQLISTLEKVILPTRPTPRRTGFWIRLTEQRMHRMFALFAALIGATWTIYLHLYEKKELPMQTVSAMRGGIASGGNVVVTASTGGSAVITTGNVTIGITLEQHEESLRSREQEIRQEIAQFGGEDKKKIALLETELAAAQLKLQNSASDLDSYKVKLIEAFKTLDKFKHVFGDDQLHQARQALANGNTTAPELLLGKILTVGKDGAAEAAYELGVLAESRIRYEEASRYYDQSVRLDPDNAQYLFAAGQIRVAIFIDSFRKTGDPRAYLSELQRAEKALDTSYQRFVSRGELTSAAMCLIKLGDTRRMQNQWDAAIEYYRRAETIAKQAHQPTHQARALMNRARAEMLGLVDHKSAGLHLEEAVRLTVAVEDKTHLFDALNFTAENQILQGQLIYALESLNRAFSLATDFNDQSRLFYGYLDRADVYEQLARKAQEQNSFDITHETLGLAMADYKEALAIAKTLRWESLAKVVEASLKHVEIMVSLSRVSQNPQSTLNVPRISRDSSERERKNLRPSMSFNSSERERMNVRSRPSR